MFISLIINRLQYNFREFAVHLTGLTTADYVYGVVFADVNVVNRVPHGGVMVWAGISYGQRTQLHFIVGNLNAQKYCDAIRGVL
jgi:hypothetical protein